MPDRGWSVLNTGDSYVRDLERAVTVLRESVALQQRELDCADKQLRYYRAIELALKRDRQKVHKTLMLLQRGTPRIGGSRFIYSIPVSNDVEAELEYKPIRQPRSLTVDDVFRSEPDMEYHELFMGLPESEKFLFLEGAYREPQLTPLHGWNLLTWIRKRREEQPDTANK